MPFQIGLIHIFLDFQNDEIDKDQEDLLTYQPQLKPVHSTTIMKKLFYGVSIAHTLPDFKKKTLNFLIKENLINSKTEQPVNTTVKPITNAVPSTNVGTTNLGFLSNNKDKENRKGPKKKLTKQDISYPTDFKHVTHVGWNSHKGFEFNGEDEEAIKPFLLKAGVSEKQVQSNIVHSNKLLLSFT